MASTNKLSVFHRFSNAVSSGAGKPVTFAMACGVVVLWAISGPIFGFSETWQLVINTATTIVTFLMVFVLQHTQNRDQDAMQAKLDELIFAQREADNSFIGIEKLATRDLEALRDRIEHAVSARTKTKPSPSAATPRQPRRQASTARPPDR